MQRPQERRVVNDLFKTRILDTLAGRRGQRDIGPLHGDIHHNNILDFGARGWLAIDPKRLIGDRAFDYREPVPAIRIWTRPAAGCRIAGPLCATRSKSSSNGRGSSENRLLRWIVAYTGLSATWCLDDNQAADVDLTVGAMALAALDGGV